MNRNNIPRLLVNKNLVENSEIEIEKNNKHYLKTVLRLSAGDEVNLFNGEDGEWQAVIKDGKKFSLSCKKKIKIQTVNNGPTLYFAVIKNHNMRWMIEKVTELGVKELFPIMTERTNNKKFNYNRSKTHIKEACEVSERLTVPFLGKISTLKKILEHSKQNSDILFFCNETRKDKSLHSYILKPSKKKISFLVGPEGGFSKNEIDLINSFKHVVSVKLYDRILRADTAAVLAISIINNFKKN